MKANSFFLFGLRKLRRICVFLTGLFICQRNIDMKHTRNAEYIHKKNKKLTTQMGMEGKTHPITQTTAPMRDKTKAIRAKGNPIKKPKGLQSSIIYNLLFSLSLFFPSIFIFLSSGINNTGQIPFRQQGYIWCLARERDPKQERLIAIIIFPSKF